MRRQFDTLLLKCMLILLCISCNTSAKAEEEANTEQDILSLDLESLMNTSVITASKASERAFDVPAAITVLNSEELRRSGQTTLMEALRMVPGVQVSRISSTSWAISSRGFADEYANKMLVMVDGRSIYSPTFSGVYWDLLNLPLQEVERIEVIRGPGASIWGANAVNGVINIVTKSSKYTQGRQVYAGIGSEEKFFAGGSIGGKFSKGTYRSYAKHLERENSDFPSGIAQVNDWSRDLAGVRADWESSARDNYTVHGEFQNGANGQQLKSSGASPNVAQLQQGYLRGLWNHGISKESNTTLSSYLDYTKRDTDILNHEVINYDIDFTHSFKPANTHELIWGAGYRVSHEAYENTSILSFSPDTSNRQLFNTFAQDKITLGNNWHWIIGSKLEHNDYTGFEFQPTTKITYNPDSDQTLWASVSRAVRTPSRSEDSVTNTLVHPGYWSVTTGSPTLNAETLSAYEAGYRLSLHSGVVLDFSAYYNDYRDFIALQGGTPYMQGSQLIYPYQLDNIGDAQVYGIENSISWQVAPDWKLAGYYNFAKLFTFTPANSKTSIDYEGLMPEHTASLRSYYNITKDIELDISLYYVSEMKNIRLNSGKTTIDDYLKTDIHLDWRPTEGLELSLVGLNLFDNHAEFIDSRFYSAAAFGPTYYGKITVNF